MKRIKKHISAIRKSKDGRTLVANFGYLSLLQIAGYVFPLITIPYLARVIGVDSFGKIAFASAIIVWFQTVSDWGFNFTATRDVAQNRDNIVKVSEIFSNVLWARVLLMLVSFVLLVITIYIVPAFRENKEIILVTFLLIPGHIMYPDWFFQAMERMKYITLMNIISKALFTIAIFIFIKNKADYILQPLIASLGFFITGSISMYIIIRNWKIKLKRPNLKRIIYTIKGSSNVFFNNIIPNLYNSFSIIILGYYKGPIYNGILDAGTKFVDTSQQFLNVIAKAFFPYLSRRIDKHGLYVRINIIASLSVSILLFFLAPFIIKIFYTDEFYEAINILRVLSITVVFMTVRNVYGTHYLLLQGYEKELRNLTFISSIIGLLVSFPLILYFGLWGVVINLVLVKGIMTITIVSKALIIKNNG